MSPLQSTALRISASPDRITARAAIAQPYGNDLKYLLGHAEDSGGAAAGGVATPATSSQRSIVARTIRSTLAILPGAALAKWLQIGPIRQ